MLAAWPEYDEAMHFAVEAALIERAKSVIRGMRQLRVDMDVPPSRKAHIFVVTADEKASEDFKSIAKLCETLAGATGITVQADKSGIGEDAVSAVIADAVMYVPLAELVDFEKERERLTKEKARLEGEVARSKGMLSNEKFVSKAPADKVAAEKEKLEQYEQMLSEVIKHLDALK